MSLAATSTGLAGSAAGVSTTAAGAGSAPGIAVKHGTADQENACQQAYGNTRGEA